MNIVGLDLSLRATGFAHDKAAFTLDQFSTLRRGERLHGLRQAIGQLLTNVDLVVVEGYSYGSTGQLFEIGELGGAVRELLFGLGIAYVVVPPATLKQFATGHGNAEKDLMIDEALKHKAVLQYRVKKDGTRKYDDNAADAWWLRQFGLYQQDESVVETTPQRDAIVAKVDWSPLVLVP